MFQRAPIAETTLRQVSFFRGLNDAQIGQIAQHLRERRYRQGEILFHQGDRGDAIYFIVSGRVRVYLNSPDGREATVRVAESGGLIGELAVLDGQPRTASCAALAPTSALLLDRADFFALLRQDFAMVEQLLATLVERIRYTTHYGAQLAFLSASGRIASTLLQLADSAEITPRLKITQQELADFASTTREYVNRTLHDFVDLGAIRLERGGVVIMDRSRLAARIV